MNIIRNIKNNKIIIILFIILLVLIYYYKKNNKEQFNLASTNNLRSNKAMYGPWGATVGAILAIDAAVKDADRVNTFLTPPRCFPKVSFFLKVNDLIRDKYFGTGFKYNYTPIKNIIINTIAPKNYATPVKIIKDIDDATLNKLIASGEAKTKNEAKKIQTDKNFEEGKEILFSMTTNYVHTGAFARITNTIAYFYSNLIEIDQTNKLVKKENDRLAGRPENTFFDCFWSHMSTQALGDTKTYPLFDRGNADLTYQTSFNVNDDYNILLPGCNSIIQVKGRKQDIEMKNLIRKTLHEIRNLIYATENTTNIQRIVFLEYGYPVECRQEPRSVVFMFILHTDGKWYGNVGGLHMRYESMLKNGNDLDADIGNNEIIYEMFLHKETYLKKINNIINFSNDPLFRQVEFNPDSSVKKALDNIVRFDNNNLIPIDVDINIYGVNTKDQIYKCKEPCNDSKWEQIVGNLKNITSDSDYIYGTNANDEIYRCTKPCKEGNFEKINGSLKTISAGSEYLYGINNKDEIFKCKAPCVDGNWTKINGSLKKISGRNDYVYGLDASDNILRCVSPCDNGIWENMNGKLKDISVGNNYIYGINSEDYIYKCTDSCNESNWQDIAGKIKIITSGKNYLYSLNDKNEIFNCEGSCSSNKWNKLVGSLKNITANT